MSGVFYIGLGDQFDDSKVEAYPPGSVVILPGNTPHFHWAKSGDYVTQVTAIGPLADHRRTANPVSSLEQEEESLGHRLRKSETRDTLSGRVAVDLAALLTFGASNHAILFHGGTRYDS
jgi:hypothetical protein